MVQVIENLARLTGHILSCSSHPRIANFDLIEMKLDSNQEVEGLPNLIANVQGDVLEISVRRGLLGSNPLGATISCRAKVTPNGVMCEPHPAADNFSISPAV